MDHQKKERILWIVVCVALGGVFLAWLRFMPLSFTQKSIEGEDGLQKITESAKGFFEKMDEGWQMMNETFNKVAAQAEEKKKFEEELKKTAEGQLFTTEPEDEQALLQALKETALKEIQEEPNNQ